MSVLGNGSGTSIPNGVDSAQNYMNVSNPAPDSSSRIDAELVNDIFTTLVTLETDLYKGRIHDVRVYGTLANAISIIGSAECTLLISSEQIISTPLTIPSNISLWFLKPGRITKQSTGTLTIAAPPVGNPMHQIFSGFAAGEVVFGVGIRVIYPEWWGTDVNTDCTTQVQSAINAVPLTSGTGFPEIILPPYQFIISSTITVPYEIPILGVGNQTNGTCLNFTGTGICLHGTFAKATRCWPLKNFKIRTGSNSNTGLTGIEITNGMTTGNFEDIEITGNVANTNLDFGINIKGNVANANATVNLFKNVTVQYAGVGIKVGYNAADGYGSNTIIEGGMLLYCRTACYQLSGDVNLIIGGDHTSIGTGVVGLYDSSHIRANTIIGTEMNADAGIPVIRLTAATAGDITALFLWGVRMRSGVGIEDLGGSNRIIGYNDYTQKFQFWGTNIDTVGNLTLPKLIQMTEMTAPSNSGANDAYLFLRDNGSGKTQMCVIFGSGVVQVIATEP